MYIIKIYDDYKSFKDIKILTNNFVKYFVYICHSILFKHTEKFDRFFV